MTKQDIVRRLAYIKYLYKTGTDQSTQSETIAYTSILTIHDAIDWFMTLACLKRSITESMKLSAIIAKDPKRKGKTNIYLMDYFAILNDLVLEAQVSNINTLRNNLKHKFILPSKIGIQESVNIARLFFEENTKIIFGLNFTDISLLDLINYKSVRTLLVNAEDLINQNFKDKAVAEIAKAFYELLHVDDIYKEDKKIYFNAEKLGKSRFNKTITPAFKGLGKGWEAHKTAERFDQYISDTITLYNRNFEKIQESLSVISLGIDYRKYLKFKYITPQIEKMDNGKWIEYSTRNIENITLEDIQFMKDFIFECSLKLQEFELE